MPNSNTYWVHSRPGGGYAATREGGKRASVTADTQAEAWGEARRLAGKSGGEAFLTRKDNHRIRARNTYGRDPFPPKG
ncbi:DUF2188 domain-containing protein [Candidatus Tokpelaia sp.]|uniref:DUF2188 domain-containing protein n=1 Tax=Candidatus Tokpelaia sp. TaxID=2233777 RepID=UPI001238FD76|nr:DUF2188 domain-containing protein [Candidatus Tokpelaia sp.]KAA6405209.1 hypothetical protein DPQ22_06705 [Candidatus Tokpelaia sp.]